jgi:hypothetical protein
VEWVGKEPIIKASHDPHRYIPSSWYKWVGEEGCSGREGWSGWGSEPNINLMIHADILVYSVLLVSGWERRDAVGVRDGVDGRMG